MTIARVAAVVAATTLALSGCALVVTPEPPSPTSAEREAFDKAADLIIEAIDVSQLEQDGDPAGAEWCVGFELNGGAEGTEILVTTEPEFEGVVGEAVDAVADQVLNDYGYTVAFEVRPGDCALDDD